MVVEARHQNIHRLRSNCSDNLRDLFRFTHTWRIKAIGTGICVGLEPLDGFIEIRAADEKALGASHEKRIAAGFVDRSSRGA